MVFNLFVDETEFFIFTDLSCCRVIICCYIVNGNFILLLKVTVPFENEIIFLFYFVGALGLYKNILIFLF